MSTFRNLLSPLPTAEVSVWPAQAQGSFYLHRRERTVPMTPPSLGGLGERRGSHQGIYPCNLCPLAETAWPGHIRPVMTAAGLAPARGVLPGCLWKGGLTLPLTSHSTAELPGPAEAGSELAVSAGKERLPRERGSGPGPRGPPLSSSPWPLSVRCPLPHDPE